MTDKHEISQLREGAGFGEALQPTLNVAVIGVSSILHQLFEAPCELPEGLDVGLGNAVVIIDDEGAQPAGGGDGVPQRLPKTLLAQLFEAPTTNLKFDSRWPRDGDEPAQVPRAEVFKSSAESPLELQPAHRAGAPLGPRDDPRAVDDGGAKRPPLTRGPRGAAEATATSVLRCRHGLL